MIKITLILSAILMLSAAFVVPNDDDDYSAEDDVGCLYENELWGSMDGTKYYFCLPGTNTSFEQSCPDDTFFVKNATVSGCLPVDKVDSNCIYAIAVEPPVCTGSALKHPQPSSDPTKFYVCTAENVAPLKLTCQPDKAFVSQDYYLGCFVWAKWRELRGCPE